MFSKCSRKGLKIKFRFLIQKVNFVDYGYMESQLDSAKRFTVIQTFDSNIPLKCERLIFSCSIRISFFIRFKTLKIHWWLALIVFTWPDQISWYDCCFEESSFSDSLSEVPYPWRPCNPDILKCPKIKQHRNHSI